jgi:hypothetical protein
MPNVNGMKFPYTPEGKAAAKKAAVMKMSSKKKKTMSAGKGFSGANSQMGPSY